MNKRQEFDFFVSKPLPMGFPEKDDFQSNDLSQFHQESTQYYNELPFSELISSSIIEWDEAIDRVRFCEDDAPLGEGCFNQVEEKMVLDVRLKVLQNQQVRVCSTTNDPCHHDHDDHKDYGC